MKKIFYGISVTALSMILSTASMAADKVLTVASWAAPFHTQNENVFPLGSGGWNSAVTFCMV